MDVSLEGIDGCLLDLHAAAADLEPTKFRAEALGILRVQVGFDAAWWRVGGAPAATAAQDVVCNGSAVGRPLPGVHPRAAAERVVWHRSDTVAGRASSMLAFERDESPFEDDQRRVLGLLASQACALWRVNARIWLLRQLNGGREAAALVGRDGLVHAATSRFHAAVRASWPDWDGGTLPAPLAAAIGAAAVILVRGTRWSVRCNGNSVVISASPLGALATLTDRERAVVAAVLSAGSQRVAAEQLGISAHTVRNTLTRVYRKLGIRGRVQLATRFPPELAVVSACGGRGP
jgi:DNA-binding CsgD family transcriptional regulator